MLPMLLRRQTNIIAGNIEDIIMSDSGKKITTVISCTTFDTVKVSDPIIFYEADRAHIIYAEDDGDRTSLGRELIDDIERRVDSDKDTEFITHASSVFSYNIMLKEINNIIKQEREEFGRFVDIYVNISSGSQEYAAAAMTACMMNPGVIPFTVRTKEYNFSVEDHRRLIGEGAPFGDSKSVYGPKMVETFSIDPPQEDMVRQLAFFASVEGSPYTMASMISLMENLGIWRYNSRDGNDKGKNASVMQFRRTVLEPLVQRGWIANGRTKNRWVITESGRAILNVFCDEDDIETFRRLREEKEHIMYCCASMPEPAIR